MSVKRTWVLKQDPGDGKMKEISDYIYEGALASLKQNIGCDFFRNCCEFCFSRNYIYTWNFNTFIHRGGFVIGAFFSVSREYGMRITKQMLEQHKPHVRVCRKH
jgi:K(+)-stimulated pyrophosphate-energized sodium pump